MRRLPFHRTSTLAVVGVALAVSLTACGKNADRAADTSASASGETDVCKTADGDGPKVGLAYDVGGRGDQSFNDSAYTGVAKAVDELDATCVEGEAADGEAESAREDRLRQMADGGATAVIGVGFAYAEAVNAVAPDYPDVSFAVVDGADTDDTANDNVAYLGFAANQSSYLVGVAAALETKTNQVGFVGGVNIPLIQAFEAGFTAGVKATKPDVTVDVAYIQQSDLSGFGDPAGGKTAAAGEFDKGADVVYHAAGASGSGVFDAAVEAGDDMWAIGVDSDQYLTATADQKPHILTSALKRVDVASYDFIKSVDDGTPVTSYVTYDLTNDGVGVSYSGGFIDDFKDQIDEATAGIKDGSIEVPSTP